jgi:2-hydroxychromene-2-carboxylate isomerase
MKQIDFHLDFISPYAYLAFAKLPEALAGIDCHVRYKPVLFAALLKHHGQLGPAEIAAKRDWTYRQVQWLAHEHGVALDRKRSIDTAIDAGGVGEVKARPIGDRVPNTRAEEPRSRRRFGPWGDC